MKQKNRIRIINNKIDLASLVRGIRGLDVEVERDSITLIRRWRGGKTREECEKTTIKRYASTDITQTFGLYRSEGQKNSDRVRFSNKDPKLHKIFIDPLRDLGITEFTAYAYYCFCEKCGREKLEKAIHEFQKITGVRVKKVYRNRLAHDPVFYTDVNNKLLAIFLNHVEEVFRKEAASGKIPKQLIAKYLRCVLDGDGYIRLHPKNLSMDVELWEKDADAAKDLKRILMRYYGINLRTYYGYCHKCSINTEKILEMLADGLIPQKYIEKVRKKLMIAYERRRLPWILVQLYMTFGRRPFLVSEASKVLQKPKNHMREKLIELQKKGYVTSIKIKIVTSKAGTPVRRLFKLTDKALKTTRLLCSLLSLSFLSHLLFDNWLACNGYGAVKTKDSLQARSVRSYCK